jgi:hypothetical protein
MGEQQDGALVLNDLNEAEQCVMEALELAIQTCTVLKEAPFSDMQAVQVLSAQFLGKLSTAGSKIFNHTDLVSSVSASHAQEMERYLMVEMARVESMLEND